VIIGLKHQNEQFFSYNKAMKQKEIKAPIIHTFCITVHIPTSIQRNKKKKHSKLEYTLVVMTSNVISNVIDYIYKVIVT
jgi:hypothetical protein